MKAIQIITPGKALVVDVPIPGIEDDQVLVKVKACVTCPQWDITLFKGIDIFERPGYPKYPLPIGFHGHEMSGKVVAVGPAVEKFKVGDRVASIISGGEDKPGFYCEYANRPVETIAKVPDSVSYEAAASLEMARYVSSHIGVMDVGGLRVGVVGLGSAGLIALQMFKSLHAREVVGIDILQPRLELARRLGADETINSSLQGDVKKLEQQSLQTSVDCSGTAAGLQAALDYTSGPVAIFGVVHGEAKFGIKHWLKGTHILPRKSPTEKDTEFVLELWRDNKLNTEALVTRRLPFERYAEGVELLIARKAIKICFYPG